MWNQTRTLRLSRDTTFMTRQTTFVTRRGTLVSKSSPCSLMISTVKKLGKTTPPLRMSHLQAGVAGSLRIWRAELWIFYVEMFISCPFKGEETSRSISGAFVLETFTAVMPRSGVAKPVRRRFGLQSLQTFYRLQKHFRVTKVFSYSFFVIQRQRDVRKKIVHPKIL